MQIESKNSSTHYISAETDAAERDNFCSSSITTTLSMAYVSSLALKVPPSPTYPSYPQNYV